MKGKDYIKFLERWEFIDNLSWEDAINNIKPEIVEDLLSEWSKIYIQSFKNDDIWGKNVGLPLIPTSAVGQIDSDLIATSLYMMIGK